jgi:hypothetical protein
MSLLLAACGSSPPPPPARPAPAAPAAGQTGTVPATAPGAAATGQAAAPKAGPVRLPAPATPRTKLELQRQLAQRLVQAHPETSYLTRAPDRLLAIPVLEIELNGDGSVRRIEVLRHPKTGPEATKLAIEAVHRAAPYGSVTHLPRPWKVVETFLFDDSLRFKPRLLDLP